MNHHPHEPLDPQERELADALARLPAIEPPPALDARVLAQAREALRPTATRPRRRPRPWWMGAGFGTAAAAVLAAGVAWQAGVFDMPFGSDVPVPRMPARSNAAAESDTAIAIDLGHAPAPAAAPAPPPPPAPPSPPATPAQQAISEPLSQTSRAIAREREETAHKAIAPATAELHRQAPAPATADTELGAITVTGSRIRPDTSSLLPHWREDELLAPEEWLERIRERVRRGERNDAALSLRRFTLKHPARNVPDELLPLLAGRP